MNLLLCLHSLLCSWWWVLLVTNIGSPYLNVIVNVILNVIVFFAYLSNRVNHQLMQKWSRSILNLGSSYVSKNQSNHQRIPWGRIQKIINIMEKGLVLIAMPLSGWHMTTPHSYCIFLLDHGHRILGIMTSHHKSYQAFKIYLHIS